jgi:hypothetical protein
MKKISLKKYMLTEDYDAMDTKFDNIDKKTFLEACKNFSSHGQSIYRTGKLKDKVEELRNLIETAEQLTLQETADWFDNVTVSRHMKQLKESFKIFEKTASEMDQLQPRLNSAYEDIAEVLQKYYDVG